MHLDIFAAVRYVISGGTAAAINLTTLYVLTEFFGFWYLLSSVIAVMLAVIASFILQKFWTFRNTRLDQIRVQLPMHAALSLGNIIFNAALLYALVEYLGMWYMLAQFLSSAILMFVNFYVYRTYVFPNTRT